MTDSATALVELNLLKDELKDAGIDSIEIAARVMINNYKRSVKCTDDYLTWNILKVFSQDSYRCFSVEQMAKRVACELNGVQEENVQKVLTTLTRHKLLRSHQSYTYREPYNKAEQVRLYGVNFDEGKMSYPWYRKAENLVAA